MSLPHMWIRCYLPSAEWNQDHIATPLASQRSVCQLTAVILSCKRKEILTDFLALFLSHFHTHIPVQSRARTHLKTEQGVRNGPLVAFWVKALGWLVLIKSKRKIYWGCKWNKTQNNQILYWRSRGKVQNKAKTNSNSDCHVLMNQLTIQHFPSTERKDFSRVNSVLAGQHHGLHLGLAAILFSQPSWASSIYFIFGSLESTSTNWFEMNR